jgi:LysR family transcriptional regulator, transcriptional activator of the cysJI operon
VCYNEKYSFFIKDITFYYIHMYSYRLRVFHAVATAGSFSRAAREILHISQPAVSKHVQALETELGMMLVQREGNHVRLTEAGRILQQYAEQVLDLAHDTQRALRELQGLQRGTLRLGASSTPGIYLLPPVLAVFVQRYPGITLELEIANSQRVVDGVLARQWDLGMIGIPLAHPQLHVEPYWRDTLVLIVAPQHRLATRPAVTLADLVGETWIFREAGSASGQVVKDVLDAAHLVQDHTLVLQGSEGVKQAVMAGLGIAMVSRYAVTLEVQQGVLRVVPITDVHAERDLCMIWRHDSSLPAAVRAFLEVLHEQAPAR